MNTDAEHKHTPKVDLKWLGISIVISVMLSKFSRHSLCQYMYLSFCWIFLTVLISQSIHKFERDNKQILSSTLGALIGWVIGTVLVWKHRKLQHLFFEHDD